LHRSSLLPLFAFFPSLLIIWGCGLTCTVHPSITGQPSSPTVAIGQPALFTVAASGSAPLSYQWLKSGTAIAGATKATYVTPPTSSADSGSAFTVTVSNAFGTLSSSPASLTVNSETISNVRFVAPDGNDSNTGTIDQPFQTIQHCATNVSQGWTCEVRAGTYRETVTPNSGITISAYDLEPVIIDGSDPLPHWTLYQGSTYKTKVSLRSDDTNQVFVGSNMMTEARWPNGDDLFHVNWATEQGGTDTGHIVDPDLPSVDWTGAKIHLWSGADPFGHETGIITASGSGQISINIDQTGTCPYICPVKGGFYYLFGTLAALDAEREWFYDSSNATLYFIAPGKVDPNTLDVRSKQRQYAIDLRGKSGVTIRNITVFASTVVTDMTSSNNILDRINAQYVSHFTNLPTASNDLTGSNFSILQVHESDSGIIINGTGNTLQNSTISYSAGAGVALEGNNNVIANTLIQNVDYIGDYASGIDLDGNGNTIQYNTIKCVGRHGIYFTAVLNQDIGYNNLFNSMMLTRDGGAIYACCNQIASETRIHHNWLHDTTPVIAGAGDSGPMSGINIDNGSSGFNVDQNVLWNNRRLNIAINGESGSGPSANYIHNNTVPDSSSDGHIAIFNVSQCAPTRIVDNRVVVSVDGSLNDTGCVLSENNSTAAGSTEMTPTTEVGCNFDGCSSDPPPVILDSGSVTPCPVTGSTQPPPRAFGLPSPEGEFAIRGCTPKSTIVPIGAKRHETTGS
jgi:hypothetical protein